MELEEKIKARIDQLEKELEKFVIDANKQIAAYQAAIGELKMLIEPPSGQGVEPPKSDKDGV